MFYLIQTFLEKLPLQKKAPLLAVVGPTGSGKTALSLKIAKEIGGEIINADSKQLYKGLETTTGAILPSETQGVPHHLFSYVPPSKIYNVVQHRKDALHVIQGIHERKKIPILVGGTGLFVNSLIQNYRFHTYPQEHSYQTGLDKKTSEELWKMLEEIDPHYLSKTDKNNRRRVISAIQHFQETGLKKSAAGIEESLFFSLILMPEIKSREALYSHINKRAEEIWHSGLLPEAKALYEAKLDENLPALKSIGIPEAFSFFRGEVSEEEAVEKMQKKSRNYAKRQLTWWRGDEKVEILLEEV
ncbi:tRNA (adenosine(37)-N6)-dimethylallyltransferase MiaA [Candidatus Peregrinibacteria bacterium]|jgi:tRNA dimethylallyltransferase|nr:tRNA (adenosine(37)-N6)-dimethylallyltransferase MiaA [Candidatus Peregrinibacteria bacterium]